MAADLRLEPEDVKALEELVEIAVSLKKSGMLDMLRVIAEKSSEILTLVGNDVATQRAMSLAYGVQKAFEEVNMDEVREAKTIIEALTACSLKAMASTSLDEAKPKGLFGMLSALRDRDVQTGLALLLAIAKRLGACIREKQGRR